MPGSAPGLEKLAVSGSGQPIDGDKEPAADSFVQPATESVTAAAGVTASLLAVQGMASPLMQGLSTHTCLVVEHMCIDQVTADDTQHPLCHAVSDCLLGLSAAGQALEEGSSRSKKPVKDDRGTEKDGDLLLAGSSAGSAKSRHGGSVYDLLVAEIKV